MHAPFISSVVMQANEAFWDTEHSAEPQNGRTGQPYNAFDVEGPLDAKSIVRRIDKHLLPLLFSLALLCSVDRGRLIFQLSKISSLLSCADIVQPQPGPVMKTDCLVITNSRGGFTAQAYLQRDGSKSWQ